MKIHRKPYKCTKTIDELLELGYDITFEGSGYADEDKWYCLLYCGDSNSPWKEGTISGIGYGITLLRAFREARDNLEVVTHYTKDKKLPVRSRFSVFLADFKVRFNK